MQLPHGTRPGGTLHSIVTTLINGFMSAADKVKLDSLPSGPIVTGVSSVFTRAGAVVAAAGDYAASLITNDSTVAGATVKDALNTLLAAIAARKFEVLYANAAGGSVVAADSFISFVSPGAGAVSATESLRQTLAPFDGTISALHIKVTSGNISVANWIATLRKNGADTAVTATVNSGANSGNSGATSVAVTKDDFLSIKITGNGTTAPAAGPVVHTIEVSN